MVQPQGTISPHSWHLLGSALRHSMHKGAFIHNRNCSERNLTHEWRREGAALALAREELEPCCSRLCPGAGEQLSGLALATHSELRVCSEECWRVLPELICHGQKHHDYHSLPELLFRVP